MPRYFLAIVVFAVFLPIAIVGSGHFFTALSDFASILGYWQAILIPPLMIEPLVFRRPVSRKTYPVDAWNRIVLLPPGWAAVIAGLSVSLLAPHRRPSADAKGLPIIAAGMSQIWWTGWIAAAIPGG